MEFRCFSLAQLRTCRLNGPASAKPFPFFYGADFDLSGQRRLRCNPVNFFNDGSFSSEQPSEPACTAWIYISQQCALSGDEILNSAFQAHQGCKLV